MKTKAFLTLALLPAVVLPLWADDPRPTPATRPEMKKEAEAGTLVLPGGISISRSLVEWWYGEPLPGSW